MNAIPIRRAADYARALLILAAAVLAGLGLRQVLGISNIALVLLPAVLASAVAYGLWPALLVSLAGALAYNFLFLPPLYTFTVASPENVVTLCVFTLAALVTSELAARLRAQGESARARARVTEALYLFSRRLTGVTGLDELLAATAAQIAAMLGVRVVLLLPEGEALRPRGAAPAGEALDEAELAAAAWAWRHGQAAGRETDRLPGGRRQFLPLRTGRGLVGIAGLAREGTAPLLTPEQRRLFDALADQAALAAERIGLAEAVERARLAAESERLRAALLTSVSHDLRTPLAAILGSATSLQAYRGVLDADAEAQLIDTIREEAERLNRFISGLLDMTRLEAGNLVPKAEPAELSDIVGSALRRAAPLLAGHRTVLALAPDLPLLRLDPVLFEQVLFNLLDNAAKYAPAGSTIEIAARRSAGRIVLSIADAGPGIPPAELERIFEKFHRAGMGTGAGDGRRAGTGLGLAICRGFVEAMGGRIAAANRQEGTGAVFSIAFPDPGPEAAA